MSRKTALVKISGDLLLHEDVIEWIRDLAKTYFVVICIGGGSQINRAFEEQKIPAKYGPLGRETENFAQRQLARNILEINQIQMQDLLADRGIIATVVIPVLDIGSVLCHVNGDIFVFSAYLGFDKIYILTLKERVREKEKKFERYPKIEVVGFSPAS